MPHRSSLLALLLIGVALAAPNDPPVRPDPARTPGDVLTTDTKTICTTGYSSRVRNVPSALKRLVFSSYGLVKRPGEDWEVDHLISLELGGSNALSNLWPEAGFTTPFNYHVKDKLENAMHDLICAGRLNLRDAQREIASDWTVAYKTYLGNLPNGGDLSPAPAPGSTQPTPAPAATLLNPAASSAGVAPPNADGSCPASAPIKGSRSMIYHEPNDRDYARTHARACFESVAAAINAGYRAPKR